MQTIVTKYHGPTNTRGSRISASCAAGRISLAYDHALNADGNHDAAALALINKLGWYGQYYASGWFRGGQPDGTGNVYVLGDPRNRLIEA
jgi:hypothetical protein